MLGEIKSIKPIDMKWCKAIILQETLTTQDIENYLPEQLTKWWTYIKRKSRLRETHRGSTHFT